MMRTNSSKFSTAGVMRSKTERSMTALSNSLLHTGRKTRVTHDEQLTCFVMREKLQTETERRSLRNGTYTQLTIQS